MSLLKPLVFGRPRAEYLLCVVNDTEFKRRAEEIRSLLKLKKNEKLGLKEVDNVRTPFIFAHTNREVSKKVIALIGAMESEFELGSSETIGLLNGEVIKPEETTKNIHFGTYATEDEPPTEILTMWIFPNATKREIIESLDGIEARIEKFYGIKPNKRTKGPQNYQLIYAIHRAHRKDKKFSEIFNEYSLGKLENYTGARSITSVNKFREYYHKYAPEEPSKTMWMLNADDPNLDISYMNIGIDQEK